MKFVIALLPCLVSVAAEFWDHPRGTAFPPLAIWNLDPTCNTCRDVETPEEKFGRDGYQCSREAGVLADCNACCQEKTLHLGLMWPAPVTGINIISSIDNAPACACCFSNGQCDSKTTESVPQPVPAPQPVPVPQPQQQQSQPISIQPLPAQQGQQGQQPIQQPFPQPQPILTPTPFEQHGQPKQQVLSNQPELPSQPMQGQMGQMGQMTGPAPVLQQGQMGQGQMGQGQMGQGQMGQEQMGQGQMGQGPMGQPTQMGQMGQMGHPGQQ